jgi:hypothetical protein
MAHSIYQKIKFSDCGWKDDFYGDKWHYLYMHYEPTSDITHIKDEDGKTIICGEDTGAIEALRKILNFEGEEISEEEYDKI